MANDQKGQGGPDAPQPDQHPAADMLRASLGTLERDALTAFLTTTQMEPDFTSHGGLDLAKLVRMLLQDVALMIVRPGSWEGAGMRDLMAGHGYHHWQHDAICEAVRKAWWKGKDPYATGAYGASGPRTPRKP